MGAQTGPHQEERRLTVRGWLEHRSHLQSFAGPIRQGWTLATIVDLLNSGQAEQAKATALLAIAALDQSAIDNGNWLLAAEFSMDHQPPFASFQRPRTLDNLEAKQTRIVDPRWISLFMARIRERDAFHIRQSSTSPGGEEEVSPGEESPAAAGTMGESRLADLRKGPEKARRRRRTVPSEASPRVAALFELLRCSGGAACRAAALLPGAA